MSRYSVSKAAVTKLTENLAHETKRYGISVFSVHPGLLPIGMSSRCRRPRGVDDLRGGRPALGRATSWTRAGGAEPEQAVDLIIRLAAGDADGLSGRHLSVHDDLDAILPTCPRCETATSTSCAPSVSRRPHSTD